MACNKIFAVLLLATIFGVVIARPGGYGGGYSLGYPSVYPISYSSYSYPSYGYGHGLHSSYSSYPSYGYGHGSGWLGDYW